VSEIDRRIARIAERQHGVVAAWQLDAVGVDARAVHRRVADGRLRPIHRGVHAVGQVALRARSRWMAAVLACGPGALLSHWDAASVHDLRAVGSGAIHVTVRARRRSRRGIRVHQASLRPEDRAIVEGIPVTSLPRTLLDLAPILDSKALRRMWERAERLEILDVRGVERVVDRANGHRGIAPLRALLRYDPRLAAAAASELERLFLDLIRDAGLPMPSVNVLVEGFLVDTYWPEARLVVELDGYEFHSDRAAFERDHRKLVRLRSAGLAYLAFTHRQVAEEPRSVVGTVRRELLG
jgi:very-short-patch-repair endonuclease